MIEYKNTDNAIIERVSSANHDGPISLTWMWEIIIRTKRLPDGLDPKVLFIVLRDRLRNLEREVRQHALRVLADLIPIIENLDDHMEFLLPDLIVNLSHVAPAVRKGTIDVLRTYLKHTSNPNEMLKELITVIPEDSNLRQGLLLAVPYFVNYNLNENTLMFLMQQLFLGIEQDFLRETAICSLVKSRSRLGAERFSNLIGAEKDKEFQALCQEHNIHLLEDNVLLETEITLESGPAITMKIHEEEENDSEGESIVRSPRKVRFGGEVVKMRTPESDSNQNSSDDNDLHTSVIIDQPTSIKITVSDNVAAIKTRHKSLIPVRISTGSNPSTPRRKVRPRRLHKSAPDLGRIPVSKIPLRSQSKSSQTENKLAVKKPGRQVDVSPVRVHNEIELFHNLTRSPDLHNNLEETIEVASPEKNTYPSFQLYKEEEKSLSPLESIVRDLSHKDDTWTKNRALDDLITVLRKKLPVDKAPLEELLQQLFLSEKQPRFQQRAQEALALVISSVDDATLNDLFLQLTSNIIKILPPPGVRLSLLVMKRTSPRKFFENLKIEPSEREAALQALIAATRIFPSSEIDLNRGIELAFNALKDNKRAVKQAALEALASLAQVAGNTMILEAINKMSKGDDDFSQLVTIVRTRLSRRQLPTVDLEGNIRYSSPREQEEFDWLCGGTPSLHKSSSVSNIKPVNDRVSANNYWRRNSRHEMDFSPNDDSSNTKIWVIDGVSFPKIANGYHETAQVNGRAYRNYDRGRSNSPPKERQKDHFTDINGNKAKRFFRQTEQFKKSFSSEQIFNNGVKNQEPTSFSVSSRSSSTSTGSSTRSGIWLKDMRSSIPVPIGSDVKLKFRSHKPSSDISNGPLIAHESICRTKLESAQPTPIIRRASAQQFTQSLPPASSGSESSGYFTPPAEHRKNSSDRFASPEQKDSADRFIPQESFEENSFSPVPEANFQIVESETSETHELEVEPRQSSASSAETTGKLEEIIDEEVKAEEPKRFSSLDEVDFEHPQARNLSRSESNLRTSLPEITDRKNLNSAPPLNEVLSLVPYSFSEQVQSLPGSVASSDNTPTKKGQSPKRLVKRSISVKISRQEARSFRPKELLNQGLAQMDSYDWETVIQGLNTLIRLSQESPEVLELQMHAICAALSKNIKNLRSQVARTACHAAGELFSTCKRGLEMELEELAAPLLQRTADTNKFLRSDANAALDAMSLNLSVPKVVGVVASKGSTHQNSVVRAASTRILSDMALRLGPEKVFQLPKETRDKFLLVGANGLSEGSLESRRYAKTLMGTLIKHHQFQKALVEAVPQHTLRHITKALNALK